MNGSPKKKDVYDALPKIPFPENTTVKKTKDAVKLAACISEQYQEYGIVITLNPNYMVMTIRIVAIGSVTEAVADTRDLLRGAILDNAFGIIFVHNHPTGSLKPSKADKKLLKDLKKAGKILNIEILDAVIVSGKRWRCML